MRITQFTFGPKRNDFKLQSGVKHAPSSQFWGTFPNHVDKSSWHWLCSTRWFFFSYWLLWTVLLWENRSGQIVYYSFLLCCHRWGGRDAAVVQSVTIYQKPDISTHFGSTFEGKHPPCPPPSILESNSSNAQTSKNHLETDPESSPESNRHQTLLSSAAELMQDWAGMNYRDHLLFCENHFHNTTLPFVLHQTSA